MPEPRGIGERLRALFGGEPSDVRMPGTPLRATGAEVVRRLEGLASEVFVFEDEAPEPPAPANAFGRRVAWVAPGRSVAALAHASGRALTGERTAVVVEAARLAEILEPLRAAVLRRTPLVVYAPAFTRGFGGLRAVAGSGAFVVVARDPQHLADLALVARRVAERALVPAVVACDGPETWETEADLHAPDDATVALFLGRVEAEIDGPTPAQRMILGEKRRTLPRWFDPDRPAALGVLPGGAESDAAAVGRREFFANHVPAIADAAFAALSELTGRTVAPVVVHGGAGKSVVVTAGAAVRTVAPVAARIDRAGLVEVPRLRPFPDERLREALAGAESVTVLERADPSEGEIPTLLRDVRAALSGAKTIVLSASFEKIGEREAEALFANMERGTAAHRRVRLGVAAPPSTSAYPRREALLARVRREYPGLETWTLPGASDASEREAAPSESVVPAPSELPWAVRRFEHQAPTFDSVPRFWGEFTEPRIEGGERSVPDPYLALGAVPACTATFHDRAGERTQAPVLDPAVCTGCGKCWTSCPDSSIAPTVLGVEALLGWALDAAGPADPGALRVKRAVRHLAGGVEKALAAKAATPAAALESAWADYEKRASLDPEERNSAAAAVGAAAGRIAALPLTVADALFPGALLLLAVNPRTCQGCGVCAAVCDDGAIAIAPNDLPAVERMRASWKAWESLPDTSGATIERLGSSPTGPLGAILAARSCLFTVTGADGAEKGSGERLAARQIAAVVESEMQRRIVAWARGLEELVEKLRQEARQTILASVPVDDLERLERAASSAAAAHPRGASLADLADRLEGEGVRPGLDLPRVRDLANAARRLEETRWRVLVGAQGVGRARYGIVVAGGAASRWAAEFPRNPFSAPVVVDLAGEGPHLATGLVEGLAVEMIEELRQVRRARLLLDRPQDLPARMEALASLSWSDLSPEEASVCPPVLVLTGPYALRAAPLVGFGRLLGCGLPVKLVVLDGREVRDEGIDTVATAMAHRGAFVLATSVAYPDHLFDGVRDAVRWTGPALIQVHAPSPLHHGFPTERLIERARAAVLSRVHPLLRYDPSAGEGARERLDLSGNPDPESEWVRGEDGKEIRPERFLAGEARFAAMNPSAVERVVRERAGAWAALRELAGARAPATPPPPPDPSAEIEERLRAFEAGEAGRQAARLRARLMELAGYAEPE